MDDLLSSYIPGSPGRNCKQCVNESWSKDHHRRYWIWYCFVLSVSFALFCVLAWNLSFKQNWSAFAYNTKYSVPNIIYTHVSWIKNYIYNSLKLILSRIKKIFFTSILQYEPKHVMLRCTRWINYLIHNIKRKLANQNCCTHSRG